MNILLIIPETSGTIASVSYNLYLALKKHTNANVYVAVLDGTKKGYDFGDMFVWETQSKLPFIGYFINQYSRISFLKHLKRKLNIDVSISTLLGCNALNAMSKVGERTIGIFHAPLEQSKTLGWKSYLSCWFSYRTSIKKLTDIFGVSRTVQEDLQRITGKNAGVLYNIHDFERISSLSNECLEEESAIFNSKVILYVGNMYSVKAPDRLVKAFAKYKENTKSSEKLVFIGAPQFGYEEVLNSVISSCSEEIQNDIYLLGKKENPYKYMSRSSVLVSPSRSEGLPGVIIEALSLNIPVIATNSSKGVWEIMQCENSYDANLNDVYVNQLGIITPNVNDDETLNIDALSKAIELVLKRDKCENVFDKMRFNGKTIVQQLLGKN